MTNKKKPQQLTVAQTTSVGNMIDQILAIIQSELNNLELVSKGQEPSTSPLQGYNSRSLNDYFDTLLKFQKHAATINDDKFGDLTPAELDQKMKEAFIEMAKKDPAFVAKLLESLPKDNT